VFVECNGRGGIGGAAEVPALEFRYLGLLLNNRLLQLASLCLHLIIVGKRFNPGPDTIINARQVPRPVLEEQPCLHSNPP